MGKGSNSNLKMMARKAAPDKQAQLEIIQNSNPAEDDVHAWIRDVKDILTYEEAAGDFADSGITPDFTGDDVRRALRTGKITVYSSNPIENGNWVTPSKMIASDYAGGGRVYTATVNTADVAWLDEEQGQLARVKSKK